MGAGILFILAAVMMTATMDMFAKFLVRDQSIPMIVWARYNFHLVLMLPLLARLGPRTVLTTRRPGLQIGRAVLLLVTTFLIFSSLKFIPLADMTTIVFAGPLIATGLSVPILGERVGPRRWLGVLIGFGGVLVVVRPGAGLLDWGAAMALAAALTYGLYQIATRAISRTDGTLTTLFYTALVGAIVTNVIVPFYWHWPSPVEWAYLALTGGLGALGQFLFIRAYGHAPASTLAPYLYTQLIWSAGLGILAFGDFPDIWTFAGAAIIAGSGIYIWHRERRRA
ncbi:MAG: DMT family transporter [Alphaproteobacteria bacterium]